MGRLIGKRPDPTGAIAKAVRDHLDPGERVLAGVYVQQPGTLGAEMSGGVNAGLAGALGTPISFSREPDPEHLTWLEQTGRLGVDEGVAKRSIYLSLALTSSRLLVLRRSRLTRRTRELIAGWPLSEIDGLEVPRNREIIQVRVAGTVLTFELPHAHRFLPQVYRDLPKLFERAVERPRSQP